MTRVYYDNELAAHDAARAESRECPIFSIYVCENLNGFYTSIFGGGGSSYYIDGKHSSETEEYAK